jgi:hypothetical protein
MGVEMKLTFDIKIKRLLKTYSGKRYLSASDIVKSRLERLKELHDYDMKQNQYKIDVATVVNKSLNKKISHLQNKINQLERENAILLKRIGRDNKC